MLVFVSFLLLNQLAGSDANKSAIIEKKGLNKLIKLSSRFSDDPSVLQEVKREMLLALVKLSVSLTLLV